MSSIEVADKAIEYALANAHRHWVAADAEEVGIRTPKIVVAVRHVHQSGRGALLRAALAIEQQFLQAGCAHEEQRQFNK